MVTLPIITQQYFVFTVRFKINVLPMVTEMKQNIPRRRDWNTGTGQNSLLIPLSSDVTHALSLPLCLSLSPSPSLSIFLLCMCLLHPSFPHPLSLSPSTPTSPSLPPNLPLYLFLPLPPHACSTNTNTQPLLPADIKELGQIGLLGLFRISGRLMGGTILGELSLHFQCRLPLCAFFRKYSGLD